jgi:hypothetical protein
MKAREALEVFKHIRELRLPGQKNDKNLNLRFFLFLSGYWIQDTPIFRGFFLRNDAKFES